MKRALDITLPLAVALLVLAAWEWAVAHWQVPVYVLPAPSAIVAAFLNNFGSLTAALTATFLITIEGFLGAVATALALTILFSQNRLIERSLYPYAVILQVTPVVAIAPLILIWIGFERINLALALLAGLISFFPVLTSTMLGLKSADFNLMDLTRLYGASRWQMLWKATVALRTAASSQRHEDRRRDCPDWRGHRGIRRGIGNCDRACLADHRIQQPAGDRHHLRRTGATGGSRRRDLRRAVAPGMVAPQALARKRDRVLAGALSGIAITPKSPSKTADVMYQAGASGDPVTSISQVTTNCAVPPNAEIASA